MPKTVHFLCTGNYYRSRFAEEFFNHHAARQGLDWTATSSGIAVDLGVNNVGPIAVSTADELFGRGIDCNIETARDPIQMQTAHLDQADLVVALSRAEHLPLLKERFPDWATEEALGGIEFWNIDDIHLIDPRVALPAIAVQVTSLLNRLAQPAPKLSCEIPARSASLAENGV